MTGWIIFWTVAAVILLVVFIIIHSMNKKKKKRRDEMLQKAQDKIREDELDRRILNNKVSIDELRAKSEHPYQSSYSSAATAEFVSKKNPIGGRIMIQIEEITSFSKRKYMLDPAEGISIGAGKENTISLPGLDIDQRQCEIGVDHAGSPIVYIQNVGLPAKVLLTRKKKESVVGAYHMELRDGDVINIQEVRFKISIIK